MICKNEFIVKIIAMTNANSSIDSREILILAEENGLIKDVNGLPALTDEMIKELE